jgi:hypothetical protein
MCSWLRTQERDFNRASLAATIQRSELVDVARRRSAYGTPVACATALPARSALAAAQLPTCFFPTLCVDLLQDLRHAVIGLEGHLESGFDGQLKGEPLAQRGWRLSGPRAHEKR